MDKGLHIRVRARKLVKATPPPQPTLTSNTRNNTNNNHKQQAVDIWVPLRDPASGRLSLQFGGGLAVRPTLSQWVFYSRNFAFYEGQVRASFRVFLVPVGLWWLWGWVWCFVEVEHVRPTGPPPNEGSADHNTNNNK